MTTTMLRLYTVVRTVYYIFIQRLTIISNGTKRRTTMTTTMIVTTSNSLKDVAEVPSNGTINNSSIKCSKISDDEDKSDVIVSSPCEDDDTAAHSYHDNCNGNDNDNDNDNDNEIVNDNDNDEHADDSGGGEDEEEKEKEATADGNITDDSILMLMSKAKSNNNENIMRDGIKKGSYRRLIIPWLLLKSRRKSPSSTLSSKKRRKGKNDECWRRSIQGPTREGSVMEMVFYNVQHISLSQS
jgi:hypothetical protein